MTDHLDSQIRDIENAVASAKESLRISEVALAAIRDSPIGAQPELKTEATERPNIVSASSKVQSGPVVQNLLKRVVGS